MTKERLQGVLVAGVAVVFTPLTYESFNQGTPLLLIGPVVSLVCVVLGSLLTIFRRPRQFAVGFLITGGIFFLVTAGVLAVWAWNWEVVF